MILAIAAILLWGSLAALGVRLAGVPPFFLVGSALSLAGLLSLPFWWRTRWRLGPLCLGVYGLFGFHFFLFMALRLAPPLPANLINYLWPLFIVVLAPLFDRSAALGWQHLSGAVLGLAGAVLALSSGAPAGPGFALETRSLLGYACALTSALIWATYSLASRRIARSGDPFPTEAVGQFCLISGLLALACHGVLEPAAAPSLRDALLLVVLGIGPMGAAFFLWDAALRRGDARRIGTLAYATPLCSTAGLALVGAGHLGTKSLMALALIIGGAALGSLSPAPRSGPAATGGLAP